MDWILEEFEAQPIPTFPGSSLSVYYDYLIDASENEDGGQAEEQQQQPAEAADAELQKNAPIKVAAQVTEDDSEEDEDAEESDGDAGDAAEDEGAAEGEQAEVEGAEDTGTIAFDEFGFLELRDPGLDAAFSLQEPPTTFDETGIKTYNELCKSMGLHPISRFVRQLNESVVDLRFYGISPRTVRAVTQALMYNPNVHTLDLSGNWLSDEAAYYIAELLLRENIALRRLIMKGCKLSARGAAWLAEGIEINHDLQELDLADNDIGDDGVLALEEALAQNDQLRELDLSNNNLGPAAASSLGKALTQNETIEVLRLARNNLYEDVPKGLRVLLRGIQQREKSFYLLDLAWNALNVPAAVPLRTFLTKSTVQELFLDHNRFPGPATDTIRIGVRKSSTLRHLKIGFNPIEADNAMNLLRACQASECMEILDLDGIRVNTDFVKVKKQLEQSRGMMIIIEGTLSDYEIKGPNLGEMMLKRARFEGFKPKKKKKKKDFGHLLLGMAEEGVETLLPEKFTEAALKKKKIKVRQELLRELYEQFSAKKSYVNVAAMLECYMQLFPDTVLPPPKQKKKKKKKKKRRKKKVKK